MECEKLGLHLLSESLESTRFGSPFGEQRWLAAETSRDWSSGGLRLRMDNLGSLTFHPAHSTLSSLIQMLSGLREDGC